MADISKISPDAGTTEYNVKDATARSDIASIVEKIPVNASSSNKFATEADIASAYHAAGTKTVAELLSSLLVAANEGNVYNMTDAGTTTADFIEGAGKPIRIGDNVGVCKVGNDYKFDLLSGFIDTSNFVEKSSTSGLLKNDGTVDTTSYVEAETGKGLSTNDYDATAKGIVDSIPLTITQLQGSLLEKFPRSEAEVLGAKNLLNNILTTSYATGIDATVDAKKVVTLNGTATTNTWFTLAGVWGSYVYPIEKGHYIFSSGATIPNGVTINIMKGTQAEDYIASLDKNNSSKEFELSQDTNTLIAVRIANGTHLDNFTFYPMISFNGGTYQPPAMTNRELTEMMAVKTGEITSAFTKAATYTYLGKIGNVVYFSLRLQGVTANADTALATIPEGFRPITMNVAIAGNSSTGGYSNFAVSLEDGSIKSGVSFNNANINFFATSWITS